MFVKESIKSDLIFLLYVYSVFKITKCVCESNILKYPLNNSQHKLFQTIVHLEFCSPPFSSLSNNQVDVKNSKLVVLFDVIKMLKTYFRGPKTVRQLCQNPKCCSFKKKRKICFRKSQ